MLCDIFEELSKASTYTGHVNFTLTSGTLTKKGMPDMSRDYNLKER